MAGFNREELRTYARDKRKEYENVLEKIVEIPSVSVDPAHKADVHRAAEYAVGLLESFGAKAKLYETKGHPLVYGRFDKRPRRTRRSPSTTTWTSSPRRAPTGRPSLSTSSAKATSTAGAARPTTRGRPSRRSSARATRSSRAFRSTSTSSGSSRKRSAARTSRPPSAPTRRSSPPARSSFRTPSGCRARGRPARRGCGASRVSASICRREKPTSIRAPPAAPPATRSPSSAA